MKSLRKNPKRRRPTEAPPEAFWKVKSLAEMSAREWESLCDGCARCCLNKFEDVEGKIHYTDAACKLLDCDSARCTDYKNRTKIVKDCVVLTPDNLSEMTCLPPTCAYRLINEGKDLYWWHPLISGDPKTVHEARISVKGRVISEKGLSDRDLMERFVKWPLSKRCRNHARNPQAES